MVKTTIEEVKTLIETLREELTDDLRDIKNEINDNSSSLKKFDAKFTKIFKKIDDISNAADNAKKTADDALDACKRNEENIATINETLVEISDKYDNLQKDNSTYVVRIRVLEKKLEDQVNRSSRKSIVVRGVKESANETWEDTRAILAKEIAKVANINEQNASSMIERVHRSRPNAYKEGKRDIIAGFYDWNDSELVKLKFRAAAMKGKVKGIFVDQKYGPLTTWRRNHALMERRKLIGDKTISNGFVAYPAKLMVKKNKTDKKYFLHKDFSEMEIPARDEPAEETDE